MMGLLSTGDAVVANTNAPNGFGQYRGTGSLPTYEQVEMAISSSDTRPAFAGDPVVQAAANSAATTPGAPTGFITQAYPQVTLTVGATGIASSATGVITVTWSAATATGANVTLPTSWVPPVGSQVVINGAASPALNGIYPVVSATSTTVVLAANSSVPTSGTSTASGTVTVYVPVAGVFVGCKYLSVSQKRTVWGNYWPGSDANTGANVVAYVINDPNAQFEVQTNNSNALATTAVATTAIGQNIGFAYGMGGSTGGNGNTANGLSTAYADAYTLQAGTPPAALNLLPFRVTALKNYTADGSNPLAGINGNDSTTAFNRIVVSFNNAMNKQSFGI